MASLSEKQSKRPKPSQPSLNFDCLHNVLLRDLAWAPLIATAANGHRTIVKLLLEKGADINATSVEGRTALHCAVANGDIALVNCYWRMAQALMPKIIS